MSSGLNYLRRDVLRIVCSMVACCMLAGCSGSTEQAPGETSVPVSSLSKIPTSKIPTAKVPNAEVPANSVETTSSSPATSEVSTQVAQQQPQTNPLIHTVRKQVEPAAETNIANDPTIPEVLLSSAHAQLCNLSVGESFPDARLSRYESRNNGSPTDLQTLFGKQATVVLFWQPDRWMAQMALADLQRDIADQFDPQQVGVVGIGVRQSSGTLGSTLKKAKASFPQLLDPEGKLFASTGSYALPRVYVLNAEGKVVWFDIEYSESTRRELAQTLAVLTAE